MNDLYAKPYTEVLAILKYLPKDEYDKIPKEEIDFYYENSDKQYDFSIDPNIPLEKQNISKKANAVLVSIFKNYFATDKQKEKLDIILKNNLANEEKLKKEKYDVNNIFPKKNKTEELVQSTALVEYKENVFTKCLNKIKSIINKLIGK